jgi:hypothetical protein
VLRTRYRLRAPGGDPFFDFGKVPNDAAGGQSEALRKFAPAFHLVNSAVSQRNHFAELVPPDTARDGHLDFAAHWKPLPEHVAGHSPSTTICILQSRFSKFNA